MYIMGEVGNIEANGTAPAVQNVQEHPVGVTDLQAQASQAQCHRPVLCIFLQRTHHILHCILHSEWRPECHQFQMTFALCLPTAREVGKRGHVLASFVRMCQSCFCVPHLNEHRQRVHRVAFHSGTLWIFLFCSISSASSLFMWGLQGWCSWQAWGGDGAEVRSRTIRGLPSGWEITCTNLRTTLAGWLMQMVFCYLCMPWRSAVAVVMRKGSS